MEAATLHPRRTETPQRWQAALRRAIDSGIRVYQVSDTGQWIATSATKPGVGYPVTEAECGCEACQLGGDEVCQHRAALRCELGRLWPESSEPLAASPIADPRQRRRDRTEIATY
jgi:hypothetical protein